MSDAVTLAWTSRNELVKPVLDQAFVYRIRDTKRNVIYVGMTAQADPALRIQAHRAASWWPKAVYAETAPTGLATARAAEAAEIHRWHPIYNQVCPVCGAQLQDNPLYKTWKRLLRESPSRLYTPWHEPDVFKQDVYRLLGPRLPHTALWIIDPAGNYEPGNVCWRNHRGSNHTALHGEIVAYVTDRKTARMCEIRDAFRLSNSLFYYHINQLLRAGRLIRRETGVYAVPPTSN